ncbi:hypothetical protein Tco_1243256 [Tanacetum coccineum]
MEILPVSTSKSTAVGDLRDSIRIKLVLTGNPIDTSKHGESNASALEDLLLRAGNHVKEVLIMNLPDHISSKSNKNCSIGEIVSLDEEEEIASFQDKYEHVGQKHKMIKNVKS